MDNLVSLLKAYGGAAVNYEVKNKILELVQLWAGATEGRSDLSYVGETYRSLQGDGFTFPPRTEISSSMIDSSAVSRLIDYEAEQILTSDYNYSLQSGSIPTFACDVELRSPLRTGSITAGIVETYSMGSVQAR